MTDGLTRTIRSARSMTRTSPATASLTPGIGFPCGQVAGWPSSSSRRASTRGEIAPWSRPASSSDSAQPRPTTSIRSHSRSAWRRKIASAAARPASVYGETKRDQENLLLERVGTLGVEGVALRLQNVYGVGQSVRNPYTGILSIFAVRLLDGASVSIFE